MVFGALGLVVSCDFVLCGTMIQEPKGVTFFGEVEVIDLCIETKGIMLFLAATYQLDALPMQGRPNLPEAPSGSEYLLSALQE